MNRALVIVLATAVAAYAPSAAAQCANGTPPPCGEPRPIARPDPRLDSLTWIVLPFTNTAQGADLEWLSTASVGMLYIDMSRWTDLHVVDDARVADLLRDIPEVRRRQLGLDSARAIARRAGAGRFVTGSFLKVGAKVLLTAKIYNTRTQAQPRTVLDTAPNAEALPGAFSRLAGRVLAVPPPSGTTLSGYGTTSIAAVREYTLGMQRMYRWRLDSAGLHFRNAIALDSTFALAHLQLIGVAGYLGLADEQTRSRAAMSRYSASLPEREQILVALSQLAVARTTQCTLGERLIALDSTDAAGWMAIGQCERSNERVQSDAAGHMRADGDWNAARRAWELALDRFQPDRAGAFHALMQLLYRPEQRLTCSIEVAVAQCPVDSLYVAANVLEADTIVNRFERWRDVRFDPPARRASARPGRLAMLTVARDIAARWTATNPDDLIGHVWYGSILLTLGDLAGAEREFAANAELGQGQLVAGSIVYGSHNIQRIALELRRERPERAALLLDSIFVDVPRRPINPVYVIALGQFGREGGPAAEEPSSRALRTAFNAAFAGAVPVNFPETVRNFAEVRALAAVPARRDAIRQEILDLGTVLGFHTLRTGPSLDTASAFPLLRYQSFFARGDTLRARTALAEYDAWGAAGRDDAFDGHAMFAAESYLELGDTTAAWQRIERFGRLWPGYALLALVDAPTTAGSLWSPAMVPSLLNSTRVIARAWLLYADLAMATGHRDEARRGYNMIVGMWEKGDAPVQPLVKRAREALAKL